MFKIQSLSKNVKKQGCCGVNLECETRGFGWKCLWWKLSEGDEL